MIKQNIQKVKGLLKDRIYSLPQILYKFYTFILLCSQKIQAKGQANLFNAVSIYSQIFRLYKKYLVDQPFHLKKLKMQRLSQALQQNNLQPIQQIMRLRDELIKELNINQNTEQIENRIIIKEMMSLEWIQQLREMSVESQLIKLDLNKNKKKDSNEMSELTNLLWYRQYKNQYLVLVEHFIGYFVGFAKKYYPALAFLNEYNKQILKELLDSEQKYYITINNVEDFIQKIKEPAIMWKIYEFTQQKVQSFEDEKSFQSELTIRVKISDTKTEKQQIFQINGGKIITEKGQKAVKNRPVIMVGSAIDSEIVIKSKYVSRKQLMIIEQRRKPLKQKEDNVSFSIVCLSLTNSTGFKYPKDWRAAIGLIFQHEDIKYEILKIQKEALPELSFDNESENTLSILPGDRQLPNCQRITFLILNGINRQKQFSLLSYDLSQITEQNGKDQHKISKILSFSKHFYIKSGVKILLKSANEIVENRISKKYKLIKGIQIKLQQFILTIL